MLAESYIHNLSPFVIQLTDTIGLRWYGLAYLLGFLTAWKMLCFFSKKQKSLLSHQQTSDFVFSCIIGVIVGGRLGFATFYDQELFYTFSNEFPWWELLFIHKGGMSSHGGILGVFFVILWWGKKNKTTPKHLMDLCSIAVAPGLFFGRIANFINAELWGEPLSETLQKNPPWWSVKYPTEISEVWLQNPLFFASKIEKLEPLRLTIFGDTSFYQNVIKETQSGTQKTIDLVAPLLTAWHPSQIYQAILNGPLLMFLLCVVWWSPKKPGVVSGWFLIFYGSFRFLTEFFRQPDTGVSLLFSFSRGQVLSVLMLVLGIVFLFFCLKHPNKKLGGIKTIFYKTK